MLEKEKKGVERGFILPKKSAQKAPRILQGLFTKKNDDHLWWQISSQQYLDVAKKRRLKRFSMLLTFSRLLSCLRVFLPHPVQECTSSLIQRRSVAKSQNFTKFKKSFSRGLPNPGDLKTSLKILFKLMTSQINLFKSIYLIQFKSIRV